MNIFLLLTTALSVSADSFFCGLATNNSTKNSKLTITTIIITVFVLCSLGTLLANGLIDVFEKIAEPLGGSILIAVAIFNFFSSLKCENGMLNDEIYCQNRLLEGFMLGSAIGIDGAIGCFTLSISGLNGLKAPIIVTITHYFLLELAYQLSNTKIGKKLSNYKLTAPIILAVSGLLKILKLF